MLRDPIACKPAVLAETDDWVAMASEYRAIAVLPGAADARIWEPEPCVVYAWEQERRSSDGGRRPAGDGRSSISRTTSLRELNQRLHDVAGDDPRRGSGGSLNPNGAHAVACGLDAPLEVEIVGHVGYYCAGMNKRATVRVRGNAGTGVAENLMSGTVVVEGNASQSAGATGRGGLLVVHGDAGARCGISMKGIDIVVRGSIGHMSAFMAQRGCLVVCGDAGDALGDSIYETHIYVRGAVAGARRRLHREGAARAPPSPSCARCSTAPGCDELDVSEFRRYGSARAALQLQDRQRRGVLMADSGGWQPGLRESYLFDRNAIAEIQRAAREGIYDIRGFGAKRRRAALRRPAAARREHLALPARGLPRALRHRRRARHAVREEAARAEDPGHDRRA